MPKLIPKSPKIVQQKVPQKVVFHHPSKKAATPVERRIPSTTTEIPTIKAEIPVIKTEPNQSFM